MKTGRELDALVAEKVMGWKRLYRVDWHGMDWMWDKKQGALYPEIQTTPQYSTSIEAAWEVVGKFTFFYLWRDGKLLDGQWECKLTEKDEREFYVVAPTAPHAICLAALRAVGVDVDKL